jgi:hypothetical protein
LVTEVLCGGLRTYTGGKQVNSGPSAFIHPPPAPSSQNILGPILEPRRANVTLAIVALAAFFFLYGALTLMLIPSAFKWARLELMQKLSQGVDQ